MEDVMTAVIIKEEMIIMMMMVEVDMDMVEAQEDYSATGDTKGTTDRQEAETEAGGLIKEEINDMATEDARMKNVWNAHCRRVQSQRKNTKRLISLKWLKIKFNPSPPKSKKWRKRWRR